MSKEFSRLRVLSRFCRLRRGIRAGIMENGRQSGAKLWRQSPRGLGEMRMKAHGKINFESKVGVGVGVGVRPSFEVE